MYKRQELEQIDGLRQRVSDALIPFAKLQRKKHVTVRERTFALYELIEGRGVQARLAAFGKDSRERAVRCWQRNTIRSTGLSWISLISWWICWERKN